MKIINSMEMGNYDCVAKLYYTGHLQEEAKGLSLAQAYRKASKLDKLIKQIEPIQTNDIVLLYEADITTLNYKIRLDIKKDPRELSEDEKDELYAFIGDAMSICIENGVIWK